MDDLAEYKRRSNRKKYAQDFPKGILDVIETDYPDRYFLMLENRIRIIPLFSSEEWVDILTKSRNSHGCRIRPIQLMKKYSAQGN